ncbi:hypothetical protein QZH41_017423 [Actinostola sp. cb2023]|nr:hypothetical protein QZH41_017423 [Actinostola sp. cb2023]
MTVCSSHRYSLGIGWRRGTQRCRVPADLCKHAKGGKPRKADRGISKALSRTILHRTGIFVAAGSASVRKSLQGLDYISSSGTEAFEDLLEVTETLGDIGQGMGWAKRQQLRLRESKRYLKSDYKVHVSKRSTVADHCRDYALSDPKEPAFQSSCDHEHTDICDRCEMLSAVIQEIEAELASQNDNMSSVLREQLSYRVKQAKNTILAWKSHLLRSVNQDAARVEVLEF